MRGAVQVEVCDPAVGEVDQPLGAAPVPQLLRDRDRLGVVDVEVGVDDVVVQPRDRLDAAKTWGGRGGRAGSGRRP